MGTIKPTVLVTACGCPGGPSVVRALKKTFRVVGCDMNPIASGRHFADAFHQTPPGDFPEFVPVIDEICKSEGVAAILPQSSSEVLAIAKHKAFLSNDGQRVVMVSEPEAIEIALDKARTYQLLEGKGIPLPPYTVIDNDSPIGAFDDLVNAVYEHGYPNSPVVMKSPGGKGGRGFFMVHVSLDRMSLGSRHWPNEKRITWVEVVKWASRKVDLDQNIGRWLVMPVLENDESKADTFDGYETLGYTKIRLDCRHGVYFHHVAQFDMDLMRDATRAVNAIGLSHFVNVQFMGGKLLEINPRISTQINYQDMNLPEIGVKLALGMANSVDFTMPDGVQTRYFHDARSWYGGKTHG